jgi:hypothetical protein
MRTFILLSSLFIAGQVMAQVDTSYQLLWYAGKKIKPNVLLTPRGDTITYNPEKGIVKVVSKSGMNKRFDNMLAELNKTSQRTDQMISKLTSLPTEIQPAFRNAIRKAYAEVKEQYGDALSNIIDLLALRPAQPLTGKGGFFDFDGNDDYPWEERIKEFRKYYADHAYDNLTNVPEPPIYDFSYCYPCDEAKKKAYENAVDRFEEKLNGTDKDMVTKALVTARAAHLLLSGPELKRVTKECDMMINYIMSRTEMRSLALIDKYIDDPYRTLAAMSVILPTHRTKLLMGEGEDRLPDDYIQRSLKATMRLLRKAIDEKDYAIVLNVQQWLATERTLQLLGSNSGDLLYDLVAFNQFKLNMNLSAKISADGGAYILGHMKGDNWFAAVPDENCKLRWVLRGPLENHTKVQLLAAEFRGPGVDVEYVGTKTWTSDIPTMRIDFCDDAEDSVTAYPFHPEDFQELWRFPAPLGVLNASEMETVTLGCFMDIKRLRAEANEMKDPAAIEKMKSEMKGQYEQMMKQYTAGTVPANTGLESMQNATRKMTEMIHRKNPGRYSFLPEVHNRDKVIVKDKINGKELFPENSATEYAWYHLTLEHDPEGPYVMELYKKK